MGCLGSQPLLYSAVRNDDRGHLLLEKLPADCEVVGVDKTVQIVDAGNTATFLALLNDGGDLHTAVAEIGERNQKHHDGWLGSQIASIKLGS